MNNFNFLVSTSRYNEPNCKAELWFILLMCGDKYPLISDLKFPGLITGYSVLNSHNIVKKLQTLLKEDPDFFQYILKIVPIDYVCKTNLEIIDEFIKRTEDKHIHQEETFRIKLIRRNSKIIERDEFIETIARNFDNPVDLENPDIIVRFEILGRYCGISYLKQDEILRVKAI
ncbi:MAG: THUMP domain-containing protein [Promethearchaeia archaeon]